MSIDLRPIEQQVMVILGASSGIGLATAQRASERGAKLVLAARSTETLEKIIGQLPGEAIAVECDVSQRQEVERVATAAIERFGRIDTWINNAGVSIYGMIEDVSEEDCRRLFDVNFWGIFHGSRAALPHLRNDGGALINLGSEVSEAVIPLQGIYSASKHAVKGFTDALRVEVERIEKASVAITLIQPTAVNTPYPLHAKNYMERRATLPTPMIEPEEVAEAILSAAQKHTRDKKVGTMSKLNTNLSNLIPSLADKLSAKQEERQKKESSAVEDASALYQASEKMGLAGELHGRH